MADSTDKEICVIILSHRELLGKEGVVAESESLPRSREVCGSRKVAALRESFLARKYELDGRRDDCACAR